MQRPRSEGQRLALLRQRAEETLRGKPVELADLSPEDIQYLVHELQVHQMELSLQNEELRRVQMELETSRDLYSNLYNFAPAGYCTISRKDHILEANQTLGAMLGIAPKALINQKLARFVAPSDQDAYYLYRRRAYASRARLIQELHMLKPTGEKMDVRLESAVDQEDNARIRVMLSDITEQKETQAALSASQELNNQLQDFAFTASHDLQEPLRKIKTFGAMLFEKYANQMDKEGLEYLKRMVRAARRMDEMLEGVLNYARTSNPAETMKLVKLDQIVYEVVDDLEIQIEQSAGRVQVGELPVIEADPLQMRQLFQNLLTNALKFTRPGVPPQVKVYAQAFASAGSERPQVKIYIEDNGVGFNMQDFHHLFEPFHRLVGRNQFDGSGLGLAICRRILERHSGSITAQSRPDEGTVFIVTLPVWQGTPPSPGS